MKLLKKLIHRYKWTKAYQHDLKHNYGTTEQQQFWKHQFNRMKFFWQKPLL